MKSARSKARKAQKQRERRKTFERQSNIRRSIPALKGHRVIGKTAQAAEARKEAEERELQINAAMPIDTATGKH